MLRRTSFAAFWVASLSLSASWAIAQDQDDAYQPPPTLGQRMETLRRNLFGNPVPQQPTRNSQQYQQYQNQSQQNQNQQSPGKNNKYYQPQRTTQGPGNNFSKNPNGVGNKRTTKPAPIMEEEELQSIPRMDVAARPARSPNNSTTSAPALNNDAPKTGFSATASSARRKIQTPPEPPKMGRRAPTEDELTESIAPKEESSETTESLRPSYPSLRQSPDADTLKPIDGPSSARRSARLQNNNVARSQTREIETADEGPEITADRVVKAPREDNVLVTRKSPVLSVETIGPRRISVGKEATYRLVLKNSGDLVAEDVVVIISMPDFAEVVDAKASMGNTQPADKQTAPAGLVWRLTALAARSEQELALQIVPRKGQPFDLGVRWTSSAVSSQATVEVQEPKLQLSISGAKEVHFGDKTLYKLTLSNPGTGDAENVMIRLLPTTQTQTAKGPASQSMGTLSAGESKSVEIELTADGAGPLTIAAEASADGNLQARATEEVVVRRAALQAAVLGPKAHYAGAPANYEIRLNNSGNASAAQVQVAAVLPPQAEFISAADGGTFDSKRHEVVWSVDSLRAGADRVLEFKCTLNAAGTNQVEVVASADDGLHSTPVVALTKVIAVADLVLTMSDPTGPVAVGHEMFYEARIRNRGTKNADNIDVKAYFSNNINLVSVEGGAEEVEPGIWKLRSIPSIAAGREVIIKIKARADAPGNHRCRVEVKCDPIGVSLVNEESTLFYADESAPAQAPAAILPGKAMLPVPNGVAPASLNEPRRFGP